MAFFYTDYCQSQLSKMNPGLSMMSMKSIRELEIPDLDPAQVYRIERGFLTSSHAFKLAQRAFKLECELNSCLFFKGGKI